MKVSIDIHVQGYMLVATAQRLLDDESFRLLQDNGAGEDGAWTSYCPSPEVITEAINKAASKITKAKLKAELKSNLRINGTCWFDTYVCDPCFGVSSEQLRQKAIEVVSDLYDYDDIKEGN